MATGEAWHQQRFVDIGYRTEVACDLCGETDRIDDTHVTWRCKHPEIVQAIEGAEGAGNLCGICGDDLPPPVLRGIPVQPSAKMGGRPLGRGHCGPPAGQGEEGAGRGMHSEKRLRAQVGRR